MAARNINSQIGEGLVDGDMASRAESLDSYLAFSVTAYGPTLDGERKLQFRALTLDGATRRIVAEHLGTQDYGCEHNLCSVVDLAERSVAWAADRFSTGAFDGLTWVGMWR